MFMYTRGKRKEEDKYRENETVRWYFCAIYAPFAVIVRLCALTLFRYFTQDFVALQMFTFSLFAALDLNMIITALFVLSSDLL